FCPICRIVLPLRGAHAELLSASARRTSRFFFFLRSGYYITDHVFSARYPGIITVVQASLLHSPPFRTELILLSGILHKIIPYPPFSTIRQPDINPTVLLSYICHLSISPNYSYLSTVRIRFCSDISSRHTPLRQLQDPLRLHRRLRRIDQR